MEERAASIIRPAARSPEGRSLPAARLRDSYTAVADREGEGRAALTGAAVERALAGLRPFARREARVSVLDAAGAEDFRVNVSAEARGQLDVQLPGREPHAHPPASPTARGDAHVDRAAPERRLHV